MTKPFNDDLVPILADSPLAQKTLNAEFGAAGFISFYTECYIRATREVISELKVKAKGLREKVDGLREAMKAAIAACVSNGEYAVAFEQFSRLLTTLGFDNVKPELPWALSHDIDDVLFLVANTRLLLHEHARMLVAATSLKIKADAAVCELDQEQRALRNELEAVNQEVLRRERAIARPEEIRERARSAHYAKTVAGVANGKEFLELVMKEVARAVRAEGTAG